MNPLFTLGSRASEGRAAVSRPRLPVLLAGLVLALTALLLGTTVQADPVTKVESQRVCMVNDTVFPTNQIPVQVGDKTYFGCCEMCKGKLATDASVRQAKDPVTGKSVDKATAVIGAKPDGKVLYFESEKSLERFANGT